jgi:hypothetical protein
VTRWPEKKEDDPFMELLAGVEKEGLGKHEWITDSQNERHANIEDDETNLTVVMVS